MKKLLGLAIALTAVVTSVKLSLPRSTPEGSLSFSSVESSSTNRTYAPLKLPPFPSSGLNLFNSSAEVANYLETFHERKAFNWNPSYPIYIPAFDNQNKPYLRKHDRGQTTALMNGFKKYELGFWRDLPLDLSALHKSFPQTSLEQLANFNKQDILWDPKMAVFDKDDVLYTVVRIRTENPSLKHYVLMYSKDHGISWQSKILLSDANLPEWYDLERPYSPNPLFSSPAFLYYQKQGKAPGYETGFEYWQGTVGRLTLQTTSFNDKGELVVDAPVEISTTAQPIGYRSGSAVKVLRSGDKYFVTWLEATLDHKLEKNKTGRPVNTVPDKKGNPYSGIWVAEYDIKTRFLKKTEVLKTWPLNDSHNQPGIVRTSKGILHVIGGAHGAHFTHAFSLKPDSIDAWSAPQFTNTTNSGYSANFNIPGVPGGSQTYVSLVIDSKDQLHLAYRLWASDKSVFNAEYFGALAYQKADCDFSDQKNVSKTCRWNSPQILVYPNAPEYTHYYQVMTIDRKENLYLEYAQMRPYAPYFFKTPTGEMINTSPMLNSALLKSEDNGKSWFLVNDEDFEH
ncbi:BNR-4 repeat-containing protein [Bdellovibrio sp. BCCA]|uniref:BNR-4 repeat-containing protein n=1 Tax=Bdellovibrio sp. BCCA TaxID=3136281 RepID=UPI0030F1793D